MLAVATLLNLPSSINKIDKTQVSFVGLFFLAVIISSLLGADLNKSIIGNYYRADGIITLAHLASLFLFTSLFFKKDWLMPASISVTVGAAAVSVLTIFQYILLHIFNFPMMNWQGAVGATFGQPNFLAGYLLSVLPFALYLLSTLKKKRERYLTSTLIIIQIIAIILTHSRAGILGIFLFIAASLILYKKQFRQYLIPLILLTATVFSFFAFNLLNQPEIEGHVSAESRTRILTKGYLASRERPLTGWGWANFDHAFESVVYPIEFLSDVYVDKAHSSFMEILVTTGFVGLTLYFAMIGRGIWRLVKAQGKIPKYLLFSLLFTVIHMQTNVVSIAEEVIFWIILGIAAGQTVKHNTLPKK